MEVYYGVVRDNRIELDNGARLAEGARVEIRPQGDTDAEGRSTTGESSRVAEAVQASLATDRLDADAELPRYLYAEGLLEEEPSWPPHGPAPFEPVVVSGEPLSEQIIRERR